MATLHSINELTRVLQRGSKLLNDMFLKRKTIAIKYDDAVETLEGNEDRVQQLIDFGIIARTADNLELDDAYQRFFEEVLSVNEEINTASVQSYIDKIKLSIRSYLAAESESRRAQFIREIRHTFKSIENATRRSVIDLKRNVDDTYKQEPNFKIKELRLKNFDEKVKVIEELIRETEKIITSEPIFFSNASDIGMKQTIAELRVGLRESTHGLIAISKQIIDYLNFIEYQSKLVKRVRQLKYLKDQYIIEEDTNVRAVLTKLHPVWTEKLPRYQTRVSLDFLRNDDRALDILNDIRNRRERKISIKSRLAPKIDDSYLNAKPERNRVVNHQEIINGFLAQSNDLFQYIWNYHFDDEMSQEERLVIFIQLASQYTAKLNYTQRTNSLNNIEYPIIYPL
jgi:hypothetical protein